MSERPQRQNGVGHIFAAARYSIGGVRRLWDETAFRHETLAFALIMIVFVLADAPAWGFVGGFVLYLMTVSIEALNTAVEELADHISPGYSQMAKHAKDLGSFAVFCLLVANGIWAGFVILAGLGHFG